MWDQFFVLVLGSMPAERGAARRLREMEMMKHRDGSAMFARWHAARDEEAAARRAAAAATTAAVNETNE